ncbi:unnamed protein product [Schistocephalus solidus]|uniref:Small conductance calcium-activated potassium channel protein n=1 Tax=Schistocephalus solidus TaxID=70667 RepID=A0A183TLS7_SCHSO|nr:unnamed protein product [Schistocephalus solidus]
MCKKEVTPTFGENLLAYIATIRVWIGTVLETITFTLWDVTIEFGIFINLTGGRSIAVALASAWRGCCEFRSAPGLPCPDPVLPSQLQYSAEAAEMKVIQLPGLVREDGPGLRSVKECRQDNGLVHLQLGVKVNTVAIPHGGLEPAEGLTGFGDPLGNLAIDSHVA